MLDAENVYLSFLPVMSFLSYSKKLSQNLFEELKKEEEMYGYILYTVISEAEEQNISRFTAG